MSSRIIGHWEVKDASVSQHTVLPDGCRDVIFRIGPDETPNWSVSPLFDRTTVVRSNDASKLRGYRIKAGVVVHDHALVQLLRGCPPSLDLVADALAETSACHVNVEDALEALAQGPQSVASAARSIGVSVRTLQRFVMTATQRPPTYWVALSRARRGARLLDSGLALHDIAYACRFADQSHMTREFQRWFGMTPARFRARPDLRAQITMTGYGDG